MSKEDNLRKILGMAAEHMGVNNPYENQPATMQKIYPSIVEFMQKTPSDWMKNGLPRESKEYVFKNSNGRRCRVKFEVEIIE